MQIEHANQQSRHKLMYGTDLQVVWDLCGDVCLAICVYTYTRGLVIVGIVVINVNTCTLEAA
jgi:hypothetical protein